MPESRFHKQLKRVACGCTAFSSVEEKLPSGKKLDCLNEKTRVCAEIEFSRNRLPYAIEKLAEAKTEGKCDRLMLVVKESDLDYANRKARGEDFEVVPQSYLLEKLVHCVVKPSESVSNDSRSS